MIVSYPATPSQAAKNAKERRNQLQRERRATPEAKAKEARATRRSYYHKSADYQPGCMCPSCANLKAEHDL
jgi:hypothetical protein